MPDHANAVGQHLALDGAMRMLGFAHAYSSW